MDIKVRNVIKINKLNFFRFEGAKRVFYTLKYNTNNTIGSTAVI